MSTLGGAGKWGHRTLIPGRRSAGARSARNGRPCPMSRKAARLRLLSESVTTTPQPTRRGTMRYMLMMHVPGGHAEYQINNWAPEEFKAHIAFMQRFNQELTEAGEFVGAEGLAPPGQAR